MRKYLLGVAFSALLVGQAAAENVGVSMARFDDNFLTVLRNGMIEYAKTLDGVDPAGRGRRQRRRQAARPDQQLRRLRRRRDHRQPGRHLGHPGHVGCRGGGGRAAGLCQPRADQRQRAARQPGLRRLGRARVRHAGDQGGLPAVQGGRQDRGQRLCDHGRAVEPGGAAAHPGHPRRDRRRRVRRQGQHHRQADVELDARRGAEPDDQLAVDRRPRSTASSPTTTRAPSAPSRR